ncbi:MAG: cardiolipin synthase [Massilibacteroides sp.]|nr:cardiolipin synthase [Massilibacteroides sp.]MDD3062088.1 cardiolipin synthase [Massilibacteroides sp.]MDD4114088.1 cardiolipin synthase [Massilibacteroides sp.]MDD4659632.1 cardiolipin synthase [Massilibacteroides sp.]
MLFAIQFAGLVQTVLSAIFFLLYIITILGLVLVIITENRNPLKTIPWVIVLLFIPGVGLAFYFFFGQDNRKQRVISRRTYKRIKKRPFQGGYKKDVCVSPDKYRQLISLLESSNQAALLYGTKIHVYASGKEKFKDLLEAIRQAKHHIHIQYYIFNDDEIGRKIQDALIVKAREGVKIRILFDDVGSWKVKKRFFDEMREEGIEVYPFLKVVFPILTSKVNYRNHRKIVIVDGEIGFMGGMNIADRYIEGLKWGIWRDTHFKFTGKGAHGLQAAFLVDWYVVTKNLIDTPEYYPVADVYNHSLMQVVTSGPVGIWRTLLQATIYAISNAKKYVYIQTPYFLPTEGLNQTLQTAALAGVDVRLMLPCKSDTRLVNLASHSFIDEMVRAGVKVYLYLPGFLHSKQIVIDDDLTIVGSANMDFRSFEHNFEVNAFVYEADFALKMKNVFNKDIGNSKMIIPSVWLKRPLKQRFIESFMRLFSPLF